jgi:hypothetical protein
MVPLGAWVAADRAGKAYRIGCAPPKSAPGRVLSRVRRGGFGSQFSGSGVAPRAASMVVISWASPVWVVSMVLARVRTAVVSAC